MANSAPIRAQRHAIILGLLRERGAASIPELAETIGVSQATVRRDLDYLAAGDYLERARGGAVLLSPDRTAFEPEFAIGAQKSRAEKNAIGRLAARRLRRGQSVLFDSSSTVLEAAKAAAGANLGLTAITNDLNIALVFAQDAKTHLIVPGGSIRAGSFTLLGAPGERFIAGLNVDMALIGIHALVDGVLSDTSIEVASIKRTMIKSARESILLVDSSKFETPTLCNVASVADVSEVITDGGAPATWLEEMERLGVPVAIAPSGSET